ncbi:MAG TPA: YibE/F family protein [Candidatus Paceibacterota bacterium]|nr:YibE/F family protein [Candidatus Paceibacterota bacterium]
MLTFRRILLVGIALLSFAPFLANAQATVTPDTQTIEKAQVTGVSDEQTQILPGTDTPAQTQTLTALILDGPDAGQSVTFENDYVQLNVGDVFYAMHTTNPLDGTDHWTVSDPYRLNALLVLAAIFLILVIVFGGLQGLRGLASLVGSIILIFFVLVPGILHGYSPILVSIGISSLIIIVGSYVTHGFNRTTSAAVLGMIATVLVTGAGAYYAVHAAHLTGFSTEEEVYLNFDTHGTIDMLGLLFGGIMIGLLGVLYDIAIGQAIAVEELFRAGVQMTKLQVYSRAIRIGREHIGALVNTLAIAYVGAALPLLLLVQEGSGYGLVYSVNSELFATEIVRILIGSIGLILGVPVTTFIASYMLYGRIRAGEPSSHRGHSHSH